MIKKIYPHYKTLNLLPKYFKQMGFYQTFKFLIKTTLFESIQIYNTKNCKYPVHVRGKTSDKKSFEQIFISEEYNIDFENHQTKKINIIDAGANCGHAALYFKSKFPKSKIICIEPEETNIEMIKINTKKIKEIIIIKKGLWYKKTNLIIINKKEKWSFIVKEYKKGDIGAISISDIIKRYRLKSVEILKIDIEGSEKKIFENLNEKITRIVKWIIVEPHDRYVPNTKKTILNYAIINKFKIIYKGENIILKNNQKRKI